MPHMQGTLGEGGSGALATREQPWAGPPSSLPADRELDLLGDSPSSGIRTPHQNPHTRYIRMSWEAACAPSAPVC